MKYTEADLEITKRLTNLHNQWKQTLYDNGLPDEYLDLYVTDGIFPFFTNQKVKVLFIGKEALEIGGYDYSELLYQAYKKHRVGNKSLNSNKFHALMMYVTYGINHNHPRYIDLPCAETIADSFGTKDGISFSFMNISKFSNESGRWPADYDLINEFINKSKYKNENLFAKEISIINPDIIIGMNLCDLFENIGSFQNFKSYGTKDQVCLQELRTVYGVYPFIDSYHFSAPYKKWDEDYYSPIIEAFKALKNN